MTLPNLDPILNGNPADAILVNDNFSKIASYVDTDLINRDGSIAMTAPLLLSATAPTNPLHAVRLSDIGSGGALGIPSGALMDFAGDATSIPAGWLLCDGSIYTTQAPYDVLYSIVGDTYNNGENLGTQFRVPDFRNRSVVGSDGVTLAYGSKFGQADSVVVEHNHTGTTDDDQHRHDYADRTRGVDKTVTTQDSGLNTGYSSDIMTTNEETDNDTHSHTFTASTEGEDGVGKNWHPVMAVNKMIKI